LADGVETASSSRQELVDVPLMADIEYQFVLRGVKDPVQSNRELYDPKIRPEVPTDLGKNRNELVPDLLRKLR
jgi:hypothetical protein